MRTEIVGDREMEEEGRRSKRRSKRRWKDVNGMKAKTLSAKEVNNRSRRPVRKSDPIEEWDKRRRKGLFVTDL